jgi:hypothetical protein
MLQEIPTNIAASIATPRHLHCCAAVMNPGLSLILCPAFVTAFPDAQPYNKAMAANPWHLHSRITRENPRAAGRTAGDPARRR